MANRKESVSTGKIVNVFNNFLSANKKILIIIGIVLVVALIALWIGLSVSSAIAQKNQLAIDQLQVSYDAWVALEDKNTAEAKASYDELVSALSAMAGKGGAKYPVLKAGYLLGLVYYTNGDYQNALNRFADVAAKGSETYLAPLSLNNCGVTSELLGDTTKALEYYQKVYDTYGNDAAESAKALFSVARIHEANKEIELAKAVFQQLVDEFPASEYAKLAQSRLVLL
ncbi:MAG: tol-pal system YbgF family protein [Sphaerochaetaceae bacterium]